MKRIMMILAATALMVGCGSSSNKTEETSGVNLIKAENFDGEVDGKKVGLYDAGH